MTTQNKPNNTNKWSNDEKQNQWSNTGGSTPQQPGKSGDTRKTTSQGQWTEGPNKAWDINASNTQKSEKTTPNKKK